MLIGSVSSGIVTLALLIIDTFNDGGSLRVRLEALNQFRNILGIVATSGKLLFLIGLILFALRRRALASRIAELEQIIAAQNSRLQ